MSPDFSLDIAHQRWFGPRDCCSHGSVRATIGGVVVTSDDPDDEYGMNQSALQLLRAIENDHVQLTRVTLDQGYLLGHGCGYPIGFGCGNFGTDWTVRHDGGDVVFSEPRTIDAMSMPQIRSFDVAVRLPIAAFRREVVEFASEARRFYFADGPRPVEDWEVDLHERFWSEFDERYARARRADLTDRASLLLSRPEDGRPISEG